MEEKQDFKMPDNPIEQTALMVKAVHWFPLVSVF